MKFTAGFIAVVTAAAPAWAIQLTNSAYAVEAGQPFTLTWSDSEGPVTVTLKNGASTDLKDVEVIGTGVTTNSFTWTPPSSLPSDLYAFEVSDSSDNSPNYSPQFTFQGNAAATTAASSSSASSSASISTTLSSLTITSSASTTTASANSSATISSTASGNSTTTSGSSSSSSSTRTSTRTSATSSSTSESTPVNTNDSQKLGSPLALILGTIVSLMIFN